MNYVKPPLSFEQQAELLLTRGLCDVEKQQLIDFLRTVNYYRLSGYLYSYKTIDHDSGKEVFFPGTSFNMIKQHYEFDRKLRLNLMDAIERIEVAIFRTQIVETHTCMYGPFGYTKYENYNPSFHREDFRKLISEIEEDESRSHEEFIERYRSKYSEEAFLPFWMAVEVMSFGQLFTQFRNSDRSLKKKISDTYGVYSPVFDSWLHSLNYVRNACAHHVRIWNRPLAIKPFIPDRKHNPEWYSPVLISNTRIFAVLTIMQFLLNRLGLNSQWKSEFIELLKCNPKIPLRNMGFPENWEDSKIWVS